MDPISAFAKNPGALDGSYETKAIEVLGKRYETETKDILKRLVNVNNYIYGKVDFPLSSNSLKEIGQFILNIIKK